MGEALAGRGANTPVEARAAAVYVATDLERNSLRESPSSAAAAIRVELTEADGFVGANPLAFDAIIATMEEHRIEVFMVVC